MVTAACARPTIGAMERRPRAGRDGALDREVEQAAQPKQSVSRGKARSSRVFAERLADSENLSEVLATVVWSRTKLWARLQSRSVW